MTENNKRALKVAAATFVSFFAAGVVVLWFILTFIWFDPFLQVVDVNIVRSVLTAWTLICLVTGLGTYLDAVR